MSLPSRSPGRMVRRFGAAALCSALVAAVWGMSATGSGSAAVPQGSAVPSASVDGARSSALTGTASVAAAVVAAGDPAERRLGPPIPPERLPAEIEAAVAKAREFLFARQVNDKVLLLLGDSDELMLHVPNPKFERVEVAAAWKDVVVSPENRTVRIKGKLYENVHLVLPPGWFGPNEWVEGEPYDMINAGGHTALITTALLAARTDPTRDPRMKAAVDCLANLWMREVRHVPPESDGTVPPLPVVGKVVPNAKTTPKAKLAEGKVRLVPWPQGTFALSTRAQAMEHALRYYRTASAARTPLQTALERDAAQLAVGHLGKGGFTFAMSDSRVKSKVGWNYGNYTMAVTQYGLFGLWAAAARFDLPSETWELHNRFLLECQNPDGGWGNTYETPTTGRLTAAGVTGLAVILDEFHTRRRGFLSPDVSPLEQNILLLKTLIALDKAVASYDKNLQFDAEGYNMFALERAAAATGAKYFGGQEWYPKGAELILRARRADGAMPPWENDVMGGSVERHTAWNLLFLVHGGAPVFVNKLRWGPRDEWRWNNYPRDAAGMARHHTESFEQEANWQIVGLTGPESDLSDAPILYVSGHREFVPEAEEIARLRRYVERGGTLLFASNGAGGAGAEFVGSVRKLLATMYPPADHPEIRLQPLPALHPVRADGAAKDPAGKLKYVGKMETLGIEHAHNGRRSFLFLLTDDIAWTWHSSAPITKAPDKVTGRQFLDAIKRYVMDRGPLPPKLRPPSTVGIAQAAARGEYKLGTVRFASKGLLRVPEGAPVPAATDWKAAYGAWGEYAPWFKHATGYELKVEAGVELTRADLAGFDALHLAGRFEYELSEAEAAALKKYVEGGGLVLIDQPGGRDVDGERAFASASLKLAKKLFPENLQRIGAGHVLFTGKFPTKAINIEGFDAAADAGLTRALLLKGTKLPQLLVASAGERPGLVLSEQGLSCGLAGETFLDREGINTRRTRELVANILISAKAFRPAKPESKKAE